MTVRQKKPDPVPSSKSPDVQFGDVDLISDFEQSDVKVKITCFLDADVLNALRIAAKEDGMKYQPYLNKILREVVLGEKNMLSKRMDALEKLVHDFKNKSSNV